MSRKKRNLDQLGAKETAWNATVYIYEIDRAHNI